MVLVRGCDLSGQRGYREFRALGRRFTAICWLEEVIWGVARKIGVLGWDFFALCWSEGVRPGAWVEILMYCEV